MLQMKLSRMQIRGLHKHYNYDNITFNQDVTFLYGLNGCGKTTVLNITEAIITGQIFKLFAYEFQTILLQYVQQDDNSNVNEMIIARDGDNMKVQFDKKEYKIVDNFIWKKKIIDKNRYYFEKYSFLLEIKELFNYACLSLDRSALLSDYEEVGESTVDTRFINYHSLSSNFQDSQNDTAMTQVEELIYWHYNHINAVKPIELFLKTINEFINRSEDEKCVQIDSEGKVCFTTKYCIKPNKIQYLSSGEKQLITFFANLIFNVKNSCIFVVDEPELSLHLSWQKPFIAQILDINKNVQLVFATHSPEIVGSRRDKMVKLTKKYVD